MKKNAFTLIELLGVIILLGILLAIGVGAYNRYLTVSKNKSFMILENSFLAAVKSAYASCATNMSDSDFCLNHTALEGYFGKSDTIYLSELVADSYIEKIKNPYGDTKQCDMNLSYVQVKNNTTTSNQGNNEKIDYTICLVCGNNKSKDCK